MGKKIQWFKDLWVHIYGNRGIFIYNIYIYIHIFIYVYSYTNIHSHRNQNEHFVTLSIDFEGTMQGEIKQRQLIYDLTYVCNIKATNSEESRETERT